MKGFMRSVEFIKGEDAILLKGGRPDAVSCTMVIEETAHSFIVEIPNFNILFETDSRDKIASLAKRSFESFFDYWLYQNGPDSFQKHMMELGFTKNQLSGKSSSRLNLGPGKEIKAITTQNLVFSV